MVDIAEFKTTAGAPAHGLAGGLPAGVAPGKIRTALVCLLGMTFATSLLPYTALGFALKPMTEQLHWSREQFGLGETYMMWSGALTVWAMGLVTDKLGARWVIIPGTLLVGLATLALAHAQALWQFYLLLALLGVVGSSGPSYAKVVVALFGGHRGKAMGLFGAEGVCVRALIPLAAGFLIARYTWRGMFDVLGIVILATAPVLFFGLDEPGAGARPPWPAQAKAAADRPPRHMAFEGRTVGEVFGDGVFWLLLAAGLVSGVINAGVFNNMVAAIEDRGFADATVAQLMSLSALFGLAGILLAGYLMDRFPSAKISAPFSLVAALGYAVLMTVTPAHGGKPMLLLGLGLGIFAFSAQLPMTGYFLTRFFGLRSFATLMGFQAFLQAVCTGFGAPLVGRIYDLDGDYRLAFELGVCATLATAAIYLVLPRYRFAARIGTAPEPAARDGAAARRSPPSNFQRRCAGGAYALLEKSGGPSATSSR